MCCIVGRQGVMVLNSVHSYYIVLKSHQTYLTRNCKSIGSGVAPVPLRKTTMNSPIASLDACLLRTDVVSWSGWKSCSPDADRPRRLY